MTHTLNLFLLPIITQVLNESLLIDAMINHDKLSKHVKTGVVTIEIVQINKKSRKPNLTSVVVERQQRDLTATNTGDLMKWHEFYASQTPYAMVEFIN